MSEVADGKCRGDDRCREVHLVAPSTEVAIMIGAHFYSIWALWIQTGQGIRIGGNGNQVGHVIVKADSPFGGIVALAPVQDDGVKGEVVVCEVGWCRVEGGGGKIERIAPITVIFTSVSATYLDGIRGVLSQPRYGIRIGGDSDCVGLVIVETDLPIVNATVLVPA